jgi:penicillin amidase
VALVALVWLGVVGVAGVPPLGLLLDPEDGLYRTARLADTYPDAAPIDGLDGPVTVVRDSRGVPHIFASTDADAVRAMGVAMAQDRLFQMDFIARVAAGRMSEAFGSSVVETDRFLRRTGMEWGAQKNWAAIEREGGRERDALVWFAQGVNAHLATLGPADLPAEMRLLGYAPEPWTPVHSLRVLQYMAYDLSYNSDAPDYSDLADRLGDDYDTLFPLHSRLAPTVAPQYDDAEGAEQAPRQTEGRPLTPRLSAYLHHIEQLTQGLPWEGLRVGKGSNNWAVAPSRSASGGAILAGDMHLSLTLPAIWYEVRIVSPSFDSYGVAVPGAPLPVEAFTPTHAWAFTNAPADQVDWFRLEPSDDGRQYRCGQTWCDVSVQPGQIAVLGGDSVADTLRFSHLGPIVERGGEWVAMKWTSHERSRTLAALWGMNAASDYAEFERATRLWDTPAMNILYAGADGEVHIRSTGYLPLRREGAAWGLQDGTLSDSVWTGRIPFDRLPARNAQADGYVQSANQMLAGAGYPYYLGQVWPAEFRAMRIDSLLRSQPLYSADDFKRYQADVHVVERDLLAPHLLALDGAALSSRARDLRAMLLGWSGRATNDLAAPTAFYHFTRTLDRLAWDEPELTRSPSEGVLPWLLGNRPDSPWLDVRATPERERAPDLLRLALNQAADTLDARYGPDTTAWRWGDHHRVVFRHITQSESLRPFWRGPVEYPGFASTLSPARGLTTTHSASWRVVVDFGGGSPTAWGIYPGGQSGNPFSSRYDLHLPAFTAFEYYDLHLTTGADDPRLSGGHTMTLTPGR